MPAPKRVRMSEGPRERDSWEDMIEGHRIFRLQPLARPMPRILHVSGRDLLAALPLLGNTFIGYRMEALLNALVWRG
jgi:hypothetical protein